MKNPFIRTEAAGGSFLPADYVARKAEMRANLLGLILFGVVMFGVVGAFFVTNRQWLNVRREQEGINVQYTQEAQKIEQLKKLENQKGEMLGKAEVTTALIEKVPRSVLMAELITRMPENITLLELQLISMRPKEAGPPPAPGQGRKARQEVKNLSGSSPAARPTSGAKGAKPDPKAGGKPADPPKPEAPKFTFTLKLIGVAQQNNDIADYIAALKQCPLLENVELKSIKARTIDKLELRGFEIEAGLKHDADARGIEPVKDLGSSDAMAGKARPDKDAVTDAAKPEGE